MTMAAAGGPSEKARSSLCDYWYPSGAPQAWATQLLGLLSSVSVDTVVSRQEGELGTHSAAILGRVWSVQDLGIPVRAHCPESPPKGRSQGLHSSHGTEDS